MAKLRNDTLDRMFIYLFIKRLLQLLQKQTKKNHGFKNLNKNFVIKPEIVKIIEHVKLQWK